MKLVRLIEKHYMNERGVEFYADKLCLSPKYVSALAKSLSGYTAQELVFKAIVRRSIFLLVNTRKTIQEISDETPTFPMHRISVLFLKNKWASRHCNIARRLREK